MSKQYLFYLLFYAFVSSVSASTQTLSLIVTGDVLPESSWRDPFAPPEEFFVHVSSIFHQADEVFINLEEPITTATLKTPFKNPQSVARGKDFILVARNPIWPKIFKESGVSIVNLANNHIGDYQEQGILDTIQSLRAAGLRTVGAGKNLEEAWEFLKIEKKGMRIAILGVTDVVPEGFRAGAEKTGVATSKDLHLLERFIQKAKEWAEVVVVMVHWGEHATTKVNLRQKRLAQNMIDWGADFIIGMHPHFLQPIELNHGKFVFYSIGNFAFPSRRRIAQESVIVKISFQPQQKTKVEMIPILISSEGQPKIVQNQKDGEAILTRLNRLCQPFQTTIFKNQKGAFELKKYKKVPTDGRKKLEAGRSF